MADRRQKLADRYGTIEGLIEDKEARIVRQRDALGTATGDEAYEIRARLDRDTAAVERLRREMAEIDRSLGGNR